MSVRATNFQSIGVSAMSPSVGTCLVRIEKQWKILIWRTLIVENHWSNMHSMDILSCLLNNKGIQASFLYNK